MKYRELQERLQEYMSRHGWVKGYCEEQERMAKKPCRDAVAAMDMDGILSLRISTGAGIFFDIMASVAGQDIIIGRFYNNGTIRRQTIGVRLFDCEIYGEEEAEDAIRHIIRDHIERQRLEKEKILGKKQNEILMLKRDLEQITLALKELDKQEAVVA